MVGQGTGSQRTFLAAAGVDDDDTGAEEGDMSGLVRIESGDCYYCCGDDMLLLP